MFSSHFKGSSSVFQHFLFFFVSRRKINVNCSGLIKSVFIAHPETCDVFFFCSKYIQIQPKVPDDESRNTKDVYSDSFDLQIYKKEQKQDL